MNRSILNLISEFLNSRFLYEDTFVELTDGKIINLMSLPDINVKQSKNALSLLFAFDGYKAELGFTAIDVNVYSVWAKFEPKMKAVTKIRRVTTMKLSSAYTDNTCMLINGGGFAKDGIQPVSLVENGQKSQYFYSCFDSNNPQDAFTVTTSLPAKFRSEINIDKTDNTFSVSLDTIIPYSFEGTVVCQEWIVSCNIPSSTALEKNAQRYSSDKIFESPIGWSTWDYYFTSATEDDVKQNVDFIATDEVLSKKVRYIALDDGWQQREGDWKSGIRYPDGLKHLVDYIKEKGFEAGIWIAPTRLHFLCGTVMRRHDFLVRDEYGDPVKDEDMYILDPTHPDGEAFLRECFTYLADCGFTFYKLDFISNLVKYADRLYDKNAGPYDALQKLIQIVRSVVPVGSHIMGCSLPYSMGADFVDSRRTGWDIHNTWDHVRLCLGTYLPQFASNEKIYRNDIDYLVVRGCDTSDDFAANVLHPSAGKFKANPTDAIRWRGGNDFNYVEAKTWCTAVLMSGSSVFMGDNLPLLKENGLELLRKTIINADFKAAVPVITGDCVVPEVWYKKETGKLYIINFSNEEKMYSIPIRDYFEHGYGRYVDIFTDVVYKTENGKLEFSLKAHDSLCLNPCRF